MGHEVYGHDPDPTGGRSVIKGAFVRLEIPEFTLIETLDQMKELNIDGLLVCTPTPLHTDGILLRDDIPIFVEKPIFDLSSRPAKSLLDGRRVVVGYNLRFHPLITAVREWMKEIGEPIWATFIVGQPNTKQYPDHVCLNWSHEIDLAEHLLGPLDLSLSRENHKMVQISFNAGNGAPVFVHLDYHSEPWVRKFMIQGENKRRIEVDFESGEALLMSSTVEGYRNLEDHLLRSDAFDESYKSEIGQFVRYIQSGKTGHFATAEDAIKVVDWFEKIMERRDQ